MAGVKQVIPVPEGVKYTAGKMTRAELNAALGRLTNLDAVSATASAEGVSYERGSVLDFCGKLTEAQKLARHIFNEDNCAPEQWDVFTQGSDYAFFNLLLGDDRAAYPMARAAHAALTGEWPQMADESGFPPEE